MKPIIEFDGSKELEKQLINSGERAEKELNKFLHSKGAKEVRQAIIGFMPISKIRKPNHAKTSNSLKVNKKNLGFEIQARGGKAGFGYLIFPNDGIGIRNPRAQQFFEKGLESKERYLLNELLRIVEL